MESKNKILDLLIELGISRADSIVPYFPKVRDRDDVSVMKCNQSGVIFLAQTDHMDISHYENKKEFVYWDTTDRKSALLAGMTDDERRYKQFKSVITGKKWLDIGTGAGGVLDLLSPVAKETAAVEPQEGVRKSLIDAGYNVYTSIDQVPDNSFEVITLFHVLEHLTSPIETLISTRKKMVSGGKIIIEIPHAGDFLLSFLDHEAFKAFTLWSEHLILHTKESVTKFLQAAGFSNIVVAGFQRYPLANHLHWLSKSKPGGHIAWPFLRTEGLDREYAAMLAAIDRTDTLIIHAVN